MATHSLTVPTSPRTALAADPAGRLRLVLTTNAATSLAAGLVAVLAAGWCVEELGLQSEGWTRVVGAGLVLFAADVALGVRSRRLATTALLTSVADLAWVAATAVVLAAVDLTTAGRVVAVVMGVGVLDFALLQLWFRSRLLR